MLPLEVLEQARAELIDWQGGGASVMEISHRSKAFEQVAAESEADLRELLSIPRNYKVLFLQGGASAQFAFVPMNLAAPESTADYVNTGHWSHKAITEAGRYCKLHVAGDAGGNYTRVPPQSELRFSAGAAYAHYTPNETIGGVEFGYVPETRGVPLVADMSSSILSRPIDVSKFGLIYAGAQKNIGPSGLTVVIVRDDLIGRARPETPLVFNWLKRAGGLAAVGERNRVKAQKLYAAIDASQFYVSRVAQDSRSWMNVTFALKEPQLDAAFLTEAADAGLQGLKGHRVSGGMRASIYNAMPLSGVEALVAFMREFERRHA
jgi:phosphoserine aminotransferase